MGYHGDETYRGGPIPESVRSPTRAPPAPRIPPEDNVPKGCSLQSMEPLREWFSKGVDMASPAEYEAALCQLEEDPPDIRQYNANIRKERWSHFSLEGVRFPAMTVVIQREERLWPSSKEISLFTFSRYREPQLCKFEHC